MNKCSLCNSCLKDVWINFNIYRWCDFCDTYYKPNGKKADKEFIQQEREKDNELRESINRNGR